MDFKYFFNKYNSVGDFDTEANKLMPLDIPLNTITGRIQSISYTSNPICVFIEVGKNQPIYKWRLDKKQWDFLTKYGKQPKKGKNVELILFLTGGIKSVNYS